MKRTLAVLCLVVGWLTFPVSAQPKRRWVDDHLLRATFSANAKEARKALQWGANANVRDADGGTPLIIMAQQAYFGQKSIAIPRLLIAHGADVNARTPKWGGTALMIAASNDWPELMNLLLDKGANLEVRDAQGKTALLAASEGVFTEIGTRLSVPDSVRLLLRRGANIHARDNQGQTALILAARSDAYDKGHREAALESVRLLLSRGANPRLASKNGNTALKWAKAKNHIAIVKLLKSKGVSK